MQAIMRRYWEDNDAAIQDYAGLAGCVAALGVDPQRFEELAESEEIRSLLVDSNNAALAQGVFGAPTVIVDGEIYWGKDRFEFIEDHLRTQD